VNILNSRVVKSYKNKNKIFLGNLVCSFLCFMQIFPLHNSYTLMKLALQSFVFKYSYAIHSKVQPDFRSCGILLTFVAFKSSFVQYKHLNHYFGIRRAKVVEWQSGNIEINPLRHFGRVSSIAIRTSAVCKYKE
jgi:hypothetical protein